jgi:hypothetical protein
LDIGDVFLVFPDPEIAFEKLGRHEQVFPAEKPSKPPYGGSLGDSHGFA